MLETRLDIRVEWGHCDPAQIVYNPNFYTWTEWGVHVLFEAAGHSVTDLVTADPLSRGLPLVKGEMTFIAPARFGDTLTLSSRITRFGRSSFDLAHRFTRGDTAIAEGTQVRIWGRADPEHPERLRAAPVPDAVRRALEDDRIVEIRTVWSR